MRSFIIRPFGTKASLAGSEIDFDAVASELIDPALAAAGLTGRETIEIVSQGNIREDMFQRLLTADVVIADITIQNANVFYELGLRHALRGRVTFLLRGRTEGDAVPFDLKTDRYMTYDVADPGGSVVALTEGLRSSIRSERADSPVFQLLPNMVPQNPDAFLVVPTEFQERVALCLAEGHLSELALMSLEVERLAPDWEIPAQRLLGDALYAAKDFDRSHTTWERVRKQSPDDLQANLRLGTIYQKQSELGKSEIALQRIVTTDPALRAEVESLRGSNAKQLWWDEWRDRAGAEAQIMALESPWLTESCDHYRRAFTTALNHAYSGINALGMTRIQIELAKAHPDTWSGLFPTDAAADEALAELAATSARMQAALELSLEDTDDPWSDVTRADLVMLTSDRPRYAIRQYRAALCDKPAQTVDAALRQIGMLTALSLLEPQASMVEHAIRAEREGRDATSTTAAPHHVIFSGHRVDAEDRKTPRFPNTPKAIETAKKAIMAALKDEQKRYPKVQICGVSGGASGGDLLFHECCDALGIESWLMLATPRDTYLAASVMDGGRDWVDRFDTIYRDRRSRAQLLLLCEAETDALPGWLSDMEDYDIWKRNNLWTLSFGMRTGAESASLIALWDGTSGDGHGGTKDMITLCNQHGIASTILSNEPLLSAG